MQLAPQVPFTEPVTIRHQLKIWLGFCVVPMGVHAEPLIAPPDWLIFMLPALVAFAVIAVLIAILIHLRRSAPKTKKLDANSQRGTAQLVNLETKRCYPIDTAPWRIGRSRINSLPVDDHSVSRVHAEISVDESGSFHLADLDSLNGVYVNEAKIELVALTHNDILDIGDVRFRFEFSTQPVGEPA